MLTSSSEGEDEEDVNCIEVVTSRSRRGGVKGVCGASGRATRKQADTASSSLEEKVAVTCRRPRFEFLEAIRTPKAIEQSWTVMMTLPERLAPKDCTHIIAQKYVWAAQAFGPEISVIPMMGTSTDVGRNWLR
jgi:hypothetical protein